MSRVLRGLTSPVDVNKRTSNLADQEIRHLEKVLNATALVDGLRSIQGLRASYWALRANRIAEEFTLLAPQKARVAVLARAFAARSTAEEVEAPIPIQAASANPVSSNLPAA